jgi:hypothetical protein
MLEACLSVNLYNLSRNMQSKISVVETINSSGPLKDRLNPLTVKQLDNKVSALLKNFEAR